MGGRSLRRRFDNLIDLKDDGSFRLDQKYFNYATGLTMTSPAFHDLFGGGPRKPETPLSQREMDLAASIQAVTEEVVMKLAAFTKKVTGERRLCMAGGVALNCVANGKLLKSGCSTISGYSRRPATPAARWGRPWRSGTRLNNGRASDGRDLMRGAYLGPAYEQTDIERRLSALGATYRVMSDFEVISNTADALVEEKAVGWMQGRMEFGPRALGGRSILGDPRSPTMQKVLNLKVKYRESFGRSRHPSGVRIWPNGSNRCRQPIHADGRQCAGQQAAAHQPRRRASCLASTG